MKSLACSAFLILLVHILAENHNITTVKWKKEQGGWKVIHSRESKLTSSLRIPAVIGRDMIKICS